MIAHRIQAGLRPDPARVVARLFLPGEELYRTHSRASQIVSRVMSLAEEEEPFVEYIVTSASFSASSEPGAHE